VPKPLVQALFKQLFSFVNVQLFNQLLLRRECCSFSNGEYVKTGLAQVCTCCVCGKGDKHTMCPMAGFAFHHMWFNPIQAFCEVVLATLTGTLSISFLPKE
jgi:hypothetical protein